MKQTPRKPAIQFIQKKINGTGLDPFRVFKKLLADKKEVFFLEGFEEWDGTSPYSYIGIDPFETLVLKNGVLEVIRQGHVIERHAKKPFKEMVTRLEGYTVPPRGEGDLAFRGGAVGFVGYECARYFEEVLAPIADKPADSSSPDACLMLFKHIVAISVGQDHFVVSSAKLTGLDPEKEQDDLITLIQSKLPPARALTKEQALRTDPDRLEFAAAMGRDDYEEGVRTIRKHIRAGDIFQCVLSDRFTVDPAGAEALDIYEVLRVSNPSPFMFFVQTPQEVTFGASPERLVKVAGGLIETNPIAGTRPRGKTPEEDKKLEKNMLASVKERAEHLMLVDLGRNDIGRVAAPGTVRVVEFMEVKKFSDVMHLISKVQGKLARGKSSWDALASCFPAGTLSGAPKIRAMQIIADLEKNQRQFYGGAIVKYEFGGDLDSCIAIRCMRMKENSVVFQAGAGIVADSSPEREYDEVMAKTRAVRRALVLARELNGAKERKK